MNGTLDGDYIISSEQRRRDEIAVGLVMRESF
jgi:hypothetical protein